jgi:hypothetical protein
MAKGDRAWLPAMFTTDADLEVRTGVTAALHPNMDEFTDAFLVENDKRIMGKDTAFDVVWQKHAGVVPA